MSGQHGPSWSGSGFRDQGIGLRAGLQEEEQRPGLTSDICTRTWHVARPRLHSKGLKMQQGRKRLCEDGHDCLRQSPPGFRQPLPQKVSDTQETHPHSLLTSALDAARSLSFFRGSPSGVLIARDHRDVGFDMLSDSPSFLRHVHVSTMRLPTPVPTRAPHLLPPVFAPNEAHVNPLLLELVLVESDHIRLSLLEGAGSEHQALQAMHITTLQLVKHVLARARNHGSGHTDMHCHKPVLFAGDDFVEARLAQTHLVQDLRNRRKLHGLVTVRSYSDLLASVQHPVVGA